MITPACFAESGQCLRLGDTVYLPQTRSFSGSLDPLEYIRLQSEYDVHCMRTGQEPSWIYRLKPIDRGPFRRDYAMGEGAEQHSIFPHLPYLGFGCVVLEDGLTDRVIQAFKLDRLRNIRQLAFLHYPIRRADGMAVLGMTFPHHRFSHVLIAATIATLVAHNLKLTPKETKTLQIAALTHDAMTPAGGDTTKLADPARVAFDEDAAYHELFTRFPAAQRLIEDEGVEQRDLISAIRGHGTLRTLLDLVDKMSYVSMDATEFFGPVNPTFAMPNQDEGMVLPPGFDRGRELLAQFPDLCALWHTIRLEDGQVVMQDADRVARFFLLRAILFRDLYYNPHSRWLEHTIASVVLRYLYESGKVTRDQFLSMTDAELEKRIDRVMGRPDLHGLVHNEFAQSASFATKEAALAYEAELMRQGNLTLLEEWYGVSGKVPNLLVRQGNTVGLFKDLCKEEADEIRTVMTVHDPYRVYGLSAERVKGSGEFQEAFAAYARARAAQVT